jgi:integrase
MASVEDRWFRPKRDPETGKVVLDERDKPVMEKTSRHGKGLRWCVRWYEPDGAERRQSFSKRVDADAHKSLVEADKLRGTYIDARAGRELFGTYATRWLADQTVDPTTREQMTHRFKVYVATHVLWRTQLGKIKPGTIQAWLRSLDSAGQDGGPIAETTKLVTFAHVNAALNAAAADELIGKNPCRSPSVRKPKPDARKIVPWSRAWVMKMRAELPERYRVFVPLGSGVGLRQGEAFGLAVEDVDFLRGWVTVQRQVKIVGGRLVFALPKGRKVRTVPLPSTVRDELAAHLAKYPARAVTLPWETPDGKPVTAHLVTTTGHGSACNRLSFNSAVWMPARKRVGIPAGRENGQHALRHYFASVLLDAGESIKAVSEYLGHASAAFTLKTYTHLMPTSDNRTRSAVDTAWHGPSTAPVALKGGATS